MECASCGLKRVITVFTHVLFEYGAGSPVILDAILPVRECLACNFEFLDHESEEIKAETISNYLLTLKNN